MSSRRHRSLVLALGVLALSLAGGCGEEGGKAATAPAAGTGAFDAARAFADLRAQVDLGPRPTGSAASGAETELLAARLRAAGVEDVRVQSPLHNVIGTIAGSEPGYVVIGAHHDTKDGIEGFLGANDGASGVAVVLELARSLPRPLPGPSIAIALFDGEEARGERPFADDGTRGSRQYVDDARGGAQGTPALDRIKAMVLFDMVGDCDLSVPLEVNSDRSLYDRFAAANPDVFAGRAFPIDDDHVPFRERGIPAVDVIDFDYGPGPSPGGWWHTPEDTVDKVCPESLGAIGDAALEAIPQIR